MNSRTSRRLLAAGAAAATGLLLLTACASGEPGAAADVGDPVSGGDFIYLDAEAPVSFQLQTGGTLWQQMAITANVTDRLVYIDPESYQATPWIAESWEEDGLVTTLTLREGVTYSDGSALDADNVVANLEQNFFGDEAKGITRQSFLPTAATVVAEDELTVVVTLAEPRAGFVNLLGHANLGLVSSATLALSKEEQAVVTNLVGSGPFVAESEDPGKEIVLTRRDGYDWAPAEAERQGEAYLDSVTIVVVQEDSVRLGTLTSGQGHALRYLPPSEYRGLKDSGYEVVAASTNGSPNGFYVKQTTEVVKDIAVRRALALGIDRESIVADLHTEEWSVGEGLLSPQSRWFVDQTDKIAYDPELAGELLDEAGWDEVGEDGIRVKDGVRLQVVTYVDVFDNTSKPRLEYIQADYKEIGVELEIRETDYASFPTAIKDPSVDLNRAATAGLDPYFLFNSLHSTRGDGFGLAGSDAKLDELLASQLTAVDDEERQAILTELQDYVIDQAYFIPVISSTQIFVTAGDVQGFRYDGNALPEFRDVWLSE